MGRRQYPQLHSVKHVTGDGRKCSACDRPAVAVARIEWDYMRGNDEFEPVCQRHAIMVENAFRRFLAHMNTKDDFLAGRSK